MEITLSSCVRKRFLIFVVLIRVLLHIWLFAEPSGWLSVYVFPFTLSILFAAKYLKFYSQYVLLKIVPRSMLKKPDPTSSLSLTSYETWGSFLNLSVPPFLSCKIRRTSLLAFPRTMKISTMEKSAREQMEASDFSSSCFSSFSSFSSTSTPMTYDQLCLAAWGAGTLTRHDGTITHFLLGRFWRPMLTTPTFKPKCVTPCLSRSHKMMFKCLEDPDLRKRKAWNREGAAGWPGKRITFNPVRRLVQ